MGEWTHTSDTHKLLGLGNHQFFLEQTSTTAFDQIQLLIDLIGAIKSHIQHGALGQILDILQAEACRLDELTALVTRREKRHLVRDGRTQGAESVDHIDDGAAGADANVAEGKVHMLLHGLEGGGALGGFDQLILLGG